MIDPNDIIAQVKKHDLKAFKTLDGAHEAVIYAVDFLQKNNDEIMASALKELAGNQRLRLGPIEGFIAAAVSLDDGEYIILSNVYPEYTTILEQAASLVHEIGSTRKFNISEQENDNRALQAIEWLKSRSSVKSNISVIKEAAEKTARKGKASLVDVLLQDKIITEEQLNDARDKMRGAHMPLHDVLIDMGFINDDQLAQIFSKVFNMPLTANQKQYLETVTSSGKLLLSVINDILDISKIEAGKVQLEAIDFDIHQLAAGTMRIIEEKVMGKAVQLNYTVDPAVPKFLKGDPTRLRQILVNLLSNAVKFTEKGEVSLSIKHDPSLDQEGKIGLWFGVRDTGIGIPADKIKLLFQPFNQADTSTTRRFGGTGLGLAICKNLVEMMGGKIWIESQETKGSVFQFNVALLLGKEIRDDKEKTFDQMDLSHVKVLVVEDSKPNQDLMKAYFNILKVNADFSNNGQEAVDHLRKRADYDVILMDMQMPLMGGVEATTIIRRDIDKKVPIVALTAAALKEDQEQCLKAGMNDFLTKPIDINKLRMTLTRYLKKEAPAKGAIVDEAKQTLKDKSANDDVRQAMLKMGSDLGLEPDEYLEILKGVFDMTDKDLPLLTAAIQQQQLGDVKAIAHRLKGTFANMRLNDLSLMMKELEKAAVENASTDIMMGAVDKIQEQLSSIKKALGA